MAEGAALQEIEKGRPDPQQSPSSNQTLTNRGNPEQGHPARVSPDHWEQCTALLEAEDEMEEERSR